MADMISFQVERLSGRCNWGREEDGEFVPAGPLPDAWGVALFVDGRFRRAAKVEREDDVPRAKKALLEWSRHH